jgi:hypothetical protein
MAMKPADPSKRPGFLLIGHPIPQPWRAPQLPKKADAHRRDRPVARLDGQIKPERADDQRERHGGRLIALPGDVARHTHYCLWPSR